MRVTEQSPSIHVARHISWPFRLHEGSRKSQHKDKHSTLDTRPPPVKAEVEATQLSLRVTEYPEETIAQH